jgi:hypothetical protein
MNNNHQISPPRVIIVVWFNMHTDTVEKKCTSINIHTGIVEKKCTGMNMHTGTVEKKCIRNFFSKPINLVIYT